MSLFFPVQQYDSFPMKLNSYSIMTSFGSNPQSFLILVVGIFLQSRDFPEVNISRYKAINTDGCFMRIINCLPFASIWVRARYFSCVVFCFCLFVSFSLVFCVLNVASFSGLSLVYVLYAQCCKDLWNVHHDCPFGFL